MKFLFTFFVIALTITARGQVTITIDPAVTIRKLSGVENGINLNYLMDGSYLSPTLSTAQSLKNAKAGLLRYPGGEKSDNYLFSAAPYHSSSPRVALVDTCFWPSNDHKFVDTLSPEGLCWPTALDFDEFMTMCSSVGASPLVVVAYDAAYNGRVCKGKPTKEQLLNHAVEWVRYANVEKKYGVKYWMIGNESWNLPDYNGKVSPAKYAADLKEFASAMKAVDSSIRIIANGRAGWWQTILQSSAVPFIDFLAFSEYPVFNYSGGYTSYLENNSSLIKEVEAAIAAIKTYAAEPHQSRIKIITSEYNSIDWGNDWPSDNNLGHALVNFQMFGDMIVKPEVEAACLWNSRWTQNVASPQSLYDAIDSDGNLNATGKVMDVWGSSLLAGMTAATSSDSLVKVYASFDSAAMKLNILLLNKSVTPKQVNVAISNYIPDYTGAVWRFSGASTEDKFPTFESVDMISDTADLSTLSIPATSVTVLRLQRDSGPSSPLSKMVIQPNPFDRTFHVKVKSDSEKDVSLVLVDLLGKIVYRQKHKLNEGNNTISLDDLGRLMKGMYFLKVDDRSESRLFKVMKM